MRRRRIAFAAPFVVVVACKRPVAEPVEPDDDEGPATGEAVMPRSSMPEPPPDAAVPIDAAIARVNPCLDRRTVHVGCNPPPPERMMNPPKPIHLRVVRIEVQGSANVLTLAGGAEQGIANDWTGCIVKSQTNDACLAGGEIVIYRVDKRTTSAKSHLTYDQITSTPFVKVWPR